jgi:hypothetical protein
MISFGSFWVEGHVILLRRYRCDGAGRITCARLQSRPCFFPAFVRQDCRIVPARSFSTRVEKAICPLPESTGENIMMVLDSIVP